MRDRVMPVPRQRQTRVMPVARTMPKRDVLNGSGRTIDPYAFPERPAPYADSRAMAIVGPDGTISRAFPNYEARSPQLQLTLAIEATIANRQHFPAEAGTGVGKSFAYLAAALASRRKTVVAVPTIALMDQLLTKDLPFLSTPGVIPGGFRYALLKGRGNYLCLQKYRTFKAEPSFSNRADGQTWHTVTEWAEATSDGDTGKLSIAMPMAIRSEITATSEECLGESCPAFAECYVERAKGIAADADLIVTNLAMLMRDIRLRVDTDGMASIMPDGVETLVIDEAHRLEDEARSASTIEVTAGRLAFIVGRITALVRRAAQNDVAERQARELIEAEAEGRMPHQITAASLIGEWKARTEAVMFAFDGMLEGYGAWLDTLEKTAQRLGDEAEYMLAPMMRLAELSAAAINHAPSGLDATDRKMWDKLPALIETLLCDLIDVSAANGDDPNRIRMVSVEETKGGRRVTLTTTPIDVSEWLSDALWSASFYRPLDKRGHAQARVPVTVIAVSATIATDSGLDFWCQRVGLDSHPRCRPGLIVGSPFDYAHHALTYVPVDAEAFDSTIARKDQAVLWPAYLNRLSTAYYDLITQSGGRAFALFTSNAILGHVYEATRHLFARDGLQVLRQGEAPQAELTRLFKSRPSVLFGVKSFWEGVDIQGDALSMVVINGLPFTPPDDPIFSAQCDALDRRYGKMASFRMLSIPQATIAIKQAYGRGIRSATDRAVIAILDGRLRSRGYGTKVLGALPPAPLTGDMADVAAFFA